jgi:hypothetical protein
MSSIKERITKKCHSDPRVTIDTIHNNIIENLNEEEKTEYYLENGLLLDQYYSKSISEKTKKTKDNSVLNYFKTTDKIPEINEENLMEENIIDYYMSNIDDSYVLNNELIMNNTCKLCNSNMSFDIIDSELLCIKCGYTEDIIINSEKTSFKDPPREVSYFAYKRINHFNEWLAQFQAKETTEIGEGIYKKIFDEIHKNVNLDIKKIKPKQMKNILKKLGYNKYYENIPHIINVMSGKKAPSLSINEEEQLRSLFKEIQIPFSNNCPSNRKNFLSYSYVLHKFCELLEYDYLLPYFPLLKSREKLQQQDKIWKLICNDLNWQFIESI